MSNHVKNVLTFKNLTKEDKEFILNTITTKTEDDSGYWIDFDKIIPEPKLEADCPEDCKVNKDSPVMMEEKDRPWFDWYDWHIKYWGTKWNAYDCYSLGQGDSLVNSLTLVFSTAWSMPYPVIERLHLLGFEFELQYADEDYGSNCGIISYEDDHGGSKRMYTFDDRDFDTDPVKFAEDLWEEY